jgi:hypothetical protein
MSNLTCGHLEIKCGNDYNGFNMNREHMPFHGLTDHVRDHFTKKILFTWKHNPIEMSKD